MVIRRSNRRRTQTERYMQYNDEMKNMENETSINVYIESDEEFDDNISATSSNDRECSGVFLPDSVTCPRVESSSGFLLNKVTQEPYDIFIDGTVEKLVYDVIAGAEISILESVENIESETISETPLNVTVEEYAQMISELKEAEADIVEFHERLDKEAKIPDAVPEVDNEQQSTEEVEEQKVEKEGGGGEKDDNVEEEMKEYGEELERIEKKDERREQGEIEERLKKLEIEMLEGLVKQYEEELEEMEKKDEHQRKEQKELQGRLEIENRKSNELERENERMKEEHQKEKSELEREKIRMKDEHQKEKIELAREIAKEMARELAKEMMDIKRFLANEITTIQIQQGQQQEQQKHIQQQQQQHDNTIQQLQHQQQQQQQQKQQQQTEQVQQEKTQQMQHEQEQQDKHQREKTQQMQYEQEQQDKQEQQKKQERQHHQQLQQSHQREGESGHYEWEKYSSGAARRSIEKMGYTGGGLGKDGNGIVEALKVENPKKKTAIFSSSITKGISKYGFNKAYTNGSAVFHRFPGGMASHIKDYMPTHLNVDKPDTVVVTCGGNDLSSTASNEAVIESLIEAGNVCKQYGVRDVFISSILPRESSHYQVKRRKCNDELRQRCLASGFTFIENNNIVLRKHVSSDGVHLNKGGSTLLCRNLLKCLNVTSSHDHDSVSQSTPL